MIRLNCEASLMSIWHEVSESHWLIKGVVRYNLMLLFINCLCLTGFNQPQNCGGWLCIFTSSLMPTSFSCMNVVRRFVSWRRSDGCSWGCWIKIHPWWKGQGFRYYPGVHYVGPGCVWEPPSDWSHWLMNFTYKYTCICTVDDLVNRHTCELTVLF